MHVFWLASAESDTKPIPNERTHRGHHRKRDQGHSTLTAPRLDYEDAEEDDESTPIAPINTGGASAGGPSRSFSGNRLNIPPEEAKQNVCSPNPPFCLEPPHCNTGSSGSAGSQCWRWSFCSQHDSGSDGGSGGLCVPSSPPGCHHQVPYHAGQEGRRPWHVPHIFPAHGARWWQEGVKLHLNVLLWLSIMTFSEWLIIIEWMFAGVSAGWAKTQEECYI